MSTVPDLHAKIANALIGLTKQIKALRYYPPHHPALQTAAEDSLNGFRPLLLARPLCLAINKNGFLLDGQAVGKTTQVVGQLAMFCFARRIQYLVILPDLTAADLHRFVSSLIQSPQELVASGGIAEVLERDRVTTIWVNEQDLATIFDRKRRLEALPPASGMADSDKRLPEQSREMELERLLKLLEQPLDDLRFHQLLQELVPLVRRSLTTEKRALVLRAMALLCRQATGQDYSAVRRDHALNAIAQVVSDDLTDFLVTFLLSEDGRDKHRKLLANVLVFLGEKIVRRLMQLLAEEPAAASRKSLSEVLLRIGPPAVPILQEQLGDERWQVVRNAVLLLGELRSQESLRLLIPLLDHEELRVRSETIRALAKIGDQQAIDTLLQAAATDDQATRRLAVLSLGSIRAACAIPTLLKLLGTSDWSRRNIDMKKEAIRALGEIRSREAVAPLARILGERRFWRRALHDELRVAAATALGEIADTSAWTELEKASRDRSATVARAATQALSLKEKATP